MLALVLASITIGGLSGAAAYAYTGDPHPAAIAAIAAMIAANLFLLGTAVLSVLEDRGRRHG